MYFGVLWLQCVVLGSRQAPSAHLISTHCHQLHHYSKLSHLRTAQKPAPKLSFPSSSTGAVLLAAAAAELPLLIHLHSVAASTSWQGKPRSSGGRESCELVPGAAARAQPQLLPVAVTAGLLCWGRSSASCLPAACLHS